MDPTTSRILAGTLGFVVTAASLVTPMTAFELVSPAQTAVVFVPASEPECVRLAAEDLVSDAKKITGIADLRDESDRTGTRLVVELKRDATPQVVLNQLYKNTQLQESFGVNMVALVDGVPHTLNLEQVIRYYLDHQMEVVERRTRFRLAKAEARAHIVAGLLIALDNIDEVVQIIRSSPDTEAARGALMKRFGLSEIQASHILDMPLRRLTALETGKLREEAEELAKLIKHLKGLLGSPGKRRALIGEELTVLRQNRHANEPLFARFQASVTMQPSRIVAHEFLSLLTTPLLSRFFSLVRGREDAWFDELISRIAAVLENTVPEVWDVELSRSQTEALWEAMRDGTPVPLHTLISSPTDRDMELACIPLLLKRGEIEILLPEPQTLLQVGDRLLFCGERHTRNLQALCLFNFNVLSYLLTGQVVPSGKVWRWVERIGKKAPNPSPGSSPGKHA